MIEIIKTRDKKVYEEYGFPYDNGTVAMAASENGQTFGAGAVTVKDGYAVLWEPMMKDEYKLFNMEFGMGKSLLNMLDLSGIKHVFSNIADERLAKALRFKDSSLCPEDIVPEEKYKYYLNLDGYFTVHDCDGE